MDCARPQASTLVELRRRDHVVSHVFELATWHRHRACLAHLIAEAHAAHRLHRLPRIRNPLFEFRKLSFLCVRHHPACATANSILGTSKPVCRDIGQVLKKKTPFIWSYCAAQSAGNCRDDRRARARKRQRKTMGKDFESA